MDGRRPLLLYKQVVDDVDIKLKDLTKSINLKGTFQRTRKDVAAFFKAALEVPHNRVYNDETLS